MHLEKKKKDKDAQHENGKGNGKGRNWLMGFKFEIATLYEMTNERTCLH